MSASLAVRLPLSLWTDTGRIPNVRVRRPRFGTYLLPTQDIAIVVSNDGDAEWIEEVIVDADDRYHLEAFKLRNATHEILVCRLPGRHFYDRRVKVDSLVPPSDLFDLLVMMAQGLWDHRT